MTLLRSSIWRNVRPFPAIWLNFTSHRALQKRHQSHKSKSAITFLTVCVWEILWRGNNGRAISKSVWLMAITADWSADWKEMMDVGKKILKLLHIKKVKQILTLRFDHKNCISFLLLLQFIHLNTVHNSIVRLCMHIYSCFGYLCGYV